MPDALPVAQPTVSKHWRESSSLNSAVTITFVNILDGHDHSMAAMSLSTHLATWQPITKQCLPGSAGNGTYAQKCLQIEMQRHFACLVSFCILWWELGLAIVTVSHRGRAGLGSGIGSSLGLVLRYVMLALSAQQCIANCLQIEMRRCFTCLASFCTLWWELGLAIVTVSHRVWYGILGLKSHSTQYRSFRRRGLIIGVVMVRVRDKFRVSVRICNVSIKCRSVVNVGITYTAAVSLSVVYNQSIDPSICQSIYLL